MNAKPTQVFDVDDAVRIINGALIVVDRLTPPDDLRVAVFGAAVNILGHHQAPAPPAALQFPGLPPGMRS